MFSFTVRSEPEDVEPVSPCLVTTIAPTTASETTVLTTFPTTTIADTTVIHTTVADDAESTMTPISDNIHVGQFVRVTSHHEVLRSNNVYTSSRISCAAKCYHDYDCDYFKYSSNSLQSYRICELVKVDCSTDINAIGELAYRKKVIC